MGELSLKRRLSWPGTKDVNTQPSKKQLSGHESMLLRSERQFNVSAPASDTGPIIFILSRPRGSESPARLVIRPEYGAAMGRFWFKVPFSMRTVARALGGRPIYWWFTVS